MRRQQGAVFVIFCVHMANPTKPACLLQQLFELITWKKYTLVVNMPR